MTDNNNSGATAFMPTLDRRKFVVGLGAAGVAAAALPGLAHAGVSVTASTDKTGLISIAGRITNSLGTPEKGAYVEILQHRVREWKADGASAVADVQSFEAPEWMGVWTDDNGVFGLHTWWSAGPVEARQIATAMPQNAEVRFNIETQDGRRLNQSLWLEANPNYMANALHDPTMLTPVSWDERAQSAQFIADFSVA